MKKESPNTSMSRRQFLAGSAALGVSALAAQTTFALNTDKAPTIRVGIVGLGGRGSLIADRVASNPHYKIAALCDYFPEVVSSMGRKYNVQATNCFDGLSGYKKLLSCNLDAVILETPPCFFPEHVAASVEAGKHVYFAKPVACDVPGTLSILESGTRARKQGQVFLIDFQIPTNTYNAEVVKRVRDGMLGQVSEISSYYCDQGFKDPQLTSTIESRLRNLIWVNDTSLGGGMLVNAGIHAIDAALWAANSKPVWAMGASRMGKLHHGDTHDVYSITYMLENGILVNHRGEHLDNQHDFICRNKIWGEDGYAETGYMGKAWIRSNKGIYRGGKVSNLYVDGIDFNLNKFAGCVAEQNYENETLEVAIESNLAVLLGREACLRKEKVTREQLISENEAWSFDVSGLKG